MGPQQIWKRLISPRLLTRFIGAEYEILVQSNPIAILRFYLSAVAILVILGISIFSISYAMQLLFHMIHVEILFSIFFSALFVFMYIYLLHTFSKESARWPKKGEIIAWLRQLGISDLIRTFFVVFMAFLISKPLEVFIFQSRLRKDVAVYKTQVFASYKKKIVNLDETDLRKLSSRIVFLEDQNKRFYSSQIEEEIQKLKNNKGDIETGMMNNLANAREQIEKSDFMLFQIQKVIGFPLSWVVMFFVVVLFMLPGLLIYFVSPRNDYFRLKHQLEEQIVTDDYKRFETLYTMILSQQAGKPTRYYSVYEDPPFNKRRIKVPEASGQEEFFKIYGTGNI